MQKLRLFTPGPTMVSPESMLAMAQPLDHHRTAGFRDDLKECVELLKYVYQTSTTPYVITGSGTAAMEAAMLGCCKPDAKTLVCHAGKFAERWRDILARFNLPYVEFQKDYGHGFKGEEILAKLKEHGDIKAVIFVHSETSTAAVSDAQGIAAACREKGALCLVDGITSIGAIPFKMDEWGIDAAVTGSQKAMMLPPGLGLVALSDRAWEVIDSHQAPTYYNDIKAYRKSMDKFDTPYTPNNQMVTGLKFTLKQIKAEGIENIWSRTAKLAKATRAAVSALGMKVFATDPVDSVTAIEIPKGVDGGKWRKDLRAKYGIHCAGGQGHIKDTIIRLNHMGYVDEVDTVGAIAALEWTLAAQGYKFESGAGTGAFSRVIQGA
ncbi:MAG: alanine--glyoxylate aminotransferase family protein [Phycisphaerales bacterium]|nr:alanine--glyoxylate aminotransferase family protein [Phycisphaerales bacterium]MCB9862385.1 alanine--glyoxylate aminotransferase family protein [Phycisphaerales bacterium]